MIDQGVTVALAVRDALRSTNGDDSHNSGTGTEGVASLSQWCERMESVFHISNCAAENQVKFATCTLHSVALTWWNTHVQTIGHEASYDMMFSEESDKVEKYVRGLPDMIHGSVVASKPKTMQEAIEIATELMDKKVRTFAEHETASKRKSENTSRTTQNQQQQHSNKRQNTDRVYTAASEAIEIATELMDKKIRTFAERETASKRKLENTSRNTQNQQQQHSNKRQNSSRVYTAAFGEKKQYVGSKPLCAKCNYHHDDPCAPKCRNCNKIGHSARESRGAAEEQQQPGKPKLKEQCSG
nr:hypothetical protein [Tanacetum cinerariifolium]